MQYRKTRLVFTVRRRELRAVQENLISKYCTEAGIACGTVKLDLLILYGGWNCVWYRKC